MNETDGIGKRIKNKEERTKTNKTNFEDIFLSHFHIK